MGYSVHNGDAAVYTGPLVAGVRYGFLQGTWNLAVEAHGGYTPPVGERLLTSSVVDGRTSTRTSRRWRRGCSTGSFRWGAASGAAG